MICLLAFAHTHMTKRATGVGDATGCAAVWRPSVLLVSRARTTRESLFWFAAMMQSSLMRIKSRGHLPLVDMCPRRVRCPDAGSMQTREGIVTSI